MLGKRHLRTGHGRADFIRIYRAHTWVPTRLRLGQQRRHHLLRDQVSEAPTGNGYTAFTSGEYHSCALDALGELICWGDNYYSQKFVPQAGPYTAVASGMLYNCALTASGDVHCWGDDNTYLVTDTPTLDGFARLALGAWHACALHSDGRILCWGENPEIGDFGFSDPDWPYPSAYGQVALSPSFNACEAPAPTTSLRLATAMVTTAASGTRRTSTTTTVTTAMATPVIRVTACYDTPTTTRSTPIAMIQIGRPTPAQLGYRRGWRRLR